MECRRIRLRSALFSTLSAIVLLTYCRDQLLTPAFAQQVASIQAPRETAIHRAARTGDLALLRSELQRGVSPNAADDQGRTPLMDAAGSGQVEATRLLLEAGAEVNARAKSGRTAVIEAAAHGRLSVTREIIAHGADLNISQRGWGTALDVAERAGFGKTAVLLRQAGAQTSGRSPGDKVCVRLWGGDGYCGTVVSVDKTRFLIRVTQIVGCEETGACPERAECSAGQPVGDSGGIAVGDEVSTVSWCLTHTGVKP